MKKSYLTIFILLFISVNAFTQTKFSTNPDSSVFQTKDIDEFWKAFDLFKKDTSVNPFGKNYIDIGSEGVKGFLPNRIKNADTLYAVVKKRKSDYEKVREATLQIKSKEKQCRSAFYALKYWYAQAQYPPVYFVIGAYNSGGTFNEDGIFIGSEIQSDINNIPYSVAHELIHFQQKTWLENPTLLQQCIVEGSDDFLGELISGENINQKANDYGNKHEERLCKEFVARMDSANYQDWMYDVLGKDDRPHDLGYWMGYKITKQFFDSAINKKQAVSDILTITDYKDFLLKSGYLKNYIK